MAFDGCDAAILAADGLTAVKIVLAATVTVWRDVLTVPMPLSSFSGMTVLP